METNLHEIANFASRQYEENKAFKKFIWQIPSSKIDVAVHQLNQVVSSQIDCTLCANCCKVLEPPVDEVEIDSLAALKEISKEDFEKSFIGYEIDTNISYLKCQPCIFLKGNSCGIYQERPASCADYPHLHHAGVKFRWRSVMENYSKCPIVFNVVEQLKQQLNYKNV